MTKINTLSSRRNRNWCKDDKNVLTLRESIMCHQHVDGKINASGVSRHIPVNLYWRLDQLRIILSHLYNRHLKLYA